MAEQKPNKTLTEYLKEGFATHDRDVAVLHVSANNEWTAFKLDGDVDGYMATQDRMTQSLQKQQMFLYLMGQCENLETATVVHRHELEDPKSPAIQGFDLMHQMLAPRAQNGMFFLEDDKEMPRFVPKLINQIFDIMKNDNHDEVILAMTFENSSMFKLALGYNVNFYHNWREEHPRQNLKTLVQQWREDKLDFCQHCVLIDRKKFLAQSDESYADLVSLSNALAEKSDATPGANSLAVKL